MRTTAVSLMACALFSGAARAGNPGAVPCGSSAEPDATVELSGGSIAAGIGYQWGHGSIIYRSQKRYFKLSGLSIVDAGAANLTSSGVIYNLKNLQDLNGNYVAASPGLTIAGCGSADCLKNEHGVVIKLLPPSPGMRFNLSANGMNVKLQDLSIVKPRLL
jgi:hypothetical protein